MRGVPTTLRSISIHRCFLLIASPRLSPPNVSGALFSIKNSTFFSTFFSSFPTHLVPSNIAVKTQEKKRFPRVASVPRLLYEVEDDKCNSVGSDAPFFHFSRMDDCRDLGGWFDRSLWQAYVSVNKIFADKVVEVISPDDEYVWVHDYHLMVLLIF
ncbi:hypothetical protein V6N13_122627 [Hibiscus sabdariffa]